MDNCKNCKAEPAYLNGLCHKCWDLEQSAKLDRIEATVNLISKRQLTNELSPTLVAAMNERGIVPEVFANLNEEQRIGFLNVVQSVMERLVHHKR